MSDISERRDTLHLSSCIGLLEQLMCCAHLVRYRVERLIIKLGWTVSRLATRSFVIVCQAVKCRVFPSTQFSLMSGRKKRMTTELYLPCMIIGIRKWLNEHCTGLSTIRDACLRDCFARVSWIQKKAFSAVQVMGCRSAFIAQKMDIAAKTHALISDTHP